MSEFTQIPFIPKYEISRDGVIRNIRTKKIRKVLLWGLYYNFSDNNWDKERKKYKTTNYKLHRILMEVFVPNPSNYPFVNHKDGNKLNNNLDNLEWCTNQQNMDHAYSTGLSNNTGENNGRSKLRNEDIPVIRKLLEDGVPGMQIAKRFNVNKSRIYNINHGRSWSHVPNIV